MLAVLEYAPWDAPIRRALNPKDWPWGDPSRDLLAGMVDEIRWLRDQVGNVAGVKQHQMHEPIKRPAAGNQQAGAIETGEATLEEIDRMLGW